MFWFFFSKRSNEGKRYIDIITIGMFIMGPNRIKFGWKTTLIAPSLVENFLLYVSPRSWTNEQNKNCESHSVLIMQFHSA